MTADMTTNRAVHVAAFKSTFFTVLGGTTWWEHGDGYAYTNVAPISPTVVHFRAPLAGGTVEVSSVAGDWSDTDMQVNTFAFAGMVPDDDAGEIGTYTVRSIFYGGDVLGVPQSLF